MEIKRFYVAWIIYILKASFIRAQIQVKLLDTSECGRTKGCFFTPVGCEENDSSARNCSEMVKWFNPRPDMLFVEIQGSTKEFTPFMGHYMTVGFSYDDKMGTDSVLACVAKPSGQLTAYVGYNDEVHYYTLRNATGQLLRNNAVGQVIDGKIVCQMTIPLKPPMQIDPAEKGMLMDLGSRSYTLMFARGIAFPDTDEMIIHHMEDGDLFPWVATEKAWLKIEGRPQWIKKAKHYDILRSVQYQLTAAHGILMLFGWWVFGAVALLFARYFKPLWPSKTMLGTKVWYQMHRDLFIISLILQVIGFIIVFIQAGDLKRCSDKCSEHPEDYALYLHTVLGIACTAGALIQPFMAWFRPAQDSGKYKIFVWLHWLLGIGSWVLATVTIFLSPPLGKTGLNRVSGLKSNYLMAAYICSYILVSLVLEGLVQLSEKPRRKIAGKSELPMETLGGPIKQMGKPIGKPVTSEPRFAPFRLVTLALFAVVAIGICIGISILIGKSLGH